MDVVLCNLKEIDNPGSRGFSWGDGPWPLEFFVVRKGAEVFGFVNRCPHAGHALNWQSDRFLTREQDLILCNSHGARFQIENGICVSGPCPGASLEPVALRIDKDQIIADADELNILMKNTIGAVLGK
jgi:nitrite reductase/ring-hydroxylating ferredoxin subunit